jgi:(p)ppGpp synthase/HD superfamily hydrolase
MAGEAHDGLVEAPTFVRRSELLSRAVAVAAEAHSGQRVAGEEAPYLRHPLEVAERLHDAGASEPVIAAAVLHDVVEDSELTVADVAVRFGEPVAALVGAMTENPAIADWVARKDALRAQVRAAGADAVAIYAADKLANARRMERLYDSRGEDAIRLYKAPTLDARVSAWRADAAMAGEVAPELEFLAELEASLDALERKRRARTPAQPA